MTQPRVDLNADVGESFGAWRLGQTPELFRHITSANVACGFHAGDPGIMRETVALAGRHGVGIGAHPGFPDLAGFGRREMQMAPADVEDMVVYQIGALWAVAAAQGARLRHVKPHGALYNMAARDPALADAIARAVVSVDRTLVLVGLRGSELIRAGGRAGLPVANEVFADRAYRDDGTLVPRTETGAVLHDPAAVVAQVGRLAALGGVDTICVHGDTPGAASLAAAVRAALASAGVTVSSLSFRPPAPA
jgi:5-oxoprolinase (ATP-hydrolysing) subunit A